MFNGSTFLNYYDVLQVDPRCDEKSLEAAYHALLKTHHPDHAKSPDTIKFNEVIEAYRVLRDRHRRAQYDLIHAETYPQQWEELGANGTASAAVDDGDAHAEILLTLYKKRRENARDAGVLGYFLQEKLGCSDDTFEFHKWYLKGKGFIATTEQGTLAITVEGIDHVIKLARGLKAEKLLIERPRAPD